jgi:hypothetical protein
LRTTLVMSRMARPSSAAATALTPICAPKIHRPTVRPSAPAVIFSLRDSGPSLASSSLRACARPPAQPSVQVPPPCSSVINGGLRGFWGVYEFWPH